MTNKALKAVRRRRQVYKKYKDNKHPAYVKASTEAATLLHQARRNFEEKLALKIKDDKRSFFAYVRSKSKGTVKVGSLEDKHGHTIFESKEKAEILNEFFGSVFTKENTSQIPVAHPCFDISSADILTDVYIDSDVIAKKLQNLRSDKAAGDDHLSPRFLKMISQEIAVPLAIIFRRSLDTGCIPYDWKTANVTPLHKKGSRSQVENYRPVSLTSQLCKVLESVIRDELVNHLDKNSLLNTSQHGFRKGLSCSSNLLTFLESVTAHIDDNKSDMDTVYTV